ncbi:hypothetical protein JTB14_027397 [Gonioctena quinquepunctata]|nr:hypothetical protein JTB14_027397 [Gonioctena quinquepunctata]
MIIWAEAVNYAVFTINQTGKSSHDDKCPADLWFGRRVDIKKLRSFGCECYVLIENHRRSKTEKKPKKGIFIGYDIDSPNYRIYIEEENDVRSDNVIFDEKLGPEKGYTELELNSEENQNSGGEETYEDETNESIHLKNKKENLNRNANDNSRKLRDRRDIRKPPNLDDYVLEYSTDDENENMALIGEIEDIAIREALKDKNWKEAMDDEFYSLTKMKTWELVELPKDVKPLTCRWILRKKQDGKQEDLNRSKVLIIQKHSVQLLDMYLLDLYSA